MNNYNDYKQLDVNYKFSLAQISHEIRNPLTLINSTVQLLAHKYPELTSDNLWEQLVKDIDYLKDLTASYSTSNTDNQLSMIPVNTEKFLTDIAKTYEADIIAEDKTLSLNFQDDLPDLICDPLKIKQCLINLIKNSNEATHRGDIIEISAKSRLNRMIITISDTGSGISEDNLENIFEPFVTYKENGNGLGLSITKKIITAHKGIIRVYSKLHIGTKFVIILPLAPQ